MFLDDLNEAQRQAVTYIDGPSLVIAGAGSGKTRVLTYKIAYLLQQGFSPYNILALTFTNKASKEMKDRIGQLVGEENARLLWMGTFHSIFARILRLESQHINYTSNYTIYDTSDSKSLLKSIIKEKGLDEKTYKPSLILNRISSAKNRLLSPNAYLNNSENIRLDVANKIPETGRIYATYVDRCKQADAMDFDDILIYTFLLFHQNQDIKNKYAERFKFILVDEYQDTNYAQHAIIWQLSQQNQQVSVVGDDAQSIYSFRGANIDYILSFQQIYKNASIFKLEENYRSTKNIVNAANSLIQHNHRQISKNIFSNKNIGSPVEIFEYYSDIEEAAGVARKIQKLLRLEHQNYEDIAILYRTNAQSRCIEESLRKMEIPYRVFGGLSFYDRKEVKDIIAYFRLTINPNDEEALKRVINYPARGIGQTTVDKIISFANNNNTSIWSVIQNIAASHLNINKTTVEKINDFQKLIESFTKDANEIDAHQIGVRIIKESGIFNDVYNGHEKEDINRQENIEALVNALAQFVENEKEEGSGRVLLQHYIQEISLLSDIDESEGEKEERVNLMTVHTAKGLEFKTVFIVGMEENLFPNLMSLNSEREIEEERRLFYVAITRAKDFCNISYAMNRFLYGKPSFCSPSRFIAEINSNYVSYNPAAQKKIDFQAPKSVSKNHLANININGQRRLRSINSTQNQADSSTSNNTYYDNIAVGKQIIHSRFGHGVIKKLEGSGVDARATVEFDNVGTKILLLRFSKFEIF